MQRYVIYSRETHARLSDVLIHGRVNYICIQNSFLCYRRFKLFLLTRNVHNYSIPGDQVPCCFTSHTLSSFMHIYHIISYSSFIHALSLFSIVFFFFCSSLWKKAVTPEMNKIKRERLARAFILYVITCSSLRSFLPFLLSSSSSSCLVENVDRMNISSILTVSLSVVSRRLNLYKFFSFYGIHGREEEIPMKGKKSDVCTHR